MAEPPHPPVANGDATTPVANGDATTPAAGAGATTPAAGPGPDNAAASAAIGAGRPVAALAAPVPGAPPGLAWWLAAGGLLVGLPLLFAALGTPQGHSYGFNLSWHVAFGEALAQGALYPRHLPALNHGIGGLDFFFYGPLPFFVSAGPAAWLCPGCAPQTVFGLAGGLWLSAAMLAFWPLARRVAPPRAAALGCLVYALLPYHLGIDWGLRQAVGEYAAYAFLPLVALGQIDMLTRGRARLALPLGVAGTILCHLPTALLAAHVFGAVAAAWALIRAATDPHAVLPRLAGLAGLGLAGAALAGLYWLPALALLGDVSPDALYTEFLQPQTWLLPPAGRLENPGMYAVALAATATGCAAAGLAIARAAPGSRTALALWTALPLALVLVLNTRLSAPLWEHWIIDRVQFPFRLFVFADLATALAAAALAARLWSAPGDRRPLVAAAPLAALGLCALAGLALSAQRIGNGLALTGTEVRMIAPVEYHPPPLAAAVAREAAASGYDDWRVVRVIGEHLDAIRAGTVAPDRLQVAPRRWQIAPPATGPGSGKTGSGDAGSTGDAAAGRTGAGDGGDGGAAAMLPVPYWRHLRAETADGTPVALAADPDWGRVVVLAPEGAGAVTVRLPAHWSEIAGGGLSLAGLAACIWIAAARRRR